MGNLARLRLAKIRTMVRQNSPDIIPKRTKKVRLGIRIFSHGTSNARGVAMLIKNKLDIVIQQELSDSRGRLLSLNVKIKDRNYRLINVYGPNKEAETICFYQNLSSTLRLMELDAGTIMLL